jgi:hypothetical protein
MSNRFRLKSDTEVVNLLDAEYTRVAELIAEQKRKLAMDRAVEIASRNNQRFGHAVRASEKEKFPYGTALGLGLMPITWTGRVVSMADWHGMTEWQKHGPNGREWSGVTNQWETPEC